MKRACAGIVAVGLVLVLVAGDALAQRGRRGGPRGGPGPGPAGAAPSRGPGGPGPIGPAGGPTLGGPRPGTFAPQNLSPGSLPGGGDRLQNVQSFLGVNRSSLPRPAVGDLAIRNWDTLANPPFSPAWYAAHPNAWQALHPHADLFVAATATGLAAWLAVPAVPVATATATTETSSESAAPNETANENHETSPTGLAESDHGAGAGADAWMNLGVFALKPAEAPVSTLVVHLAVCRDGVVRGSQFDTVSEKSANLRGAVDKTSLRIRWSAEDEPGRVFHAPLGELTKPEGKLVFQAPEAKPAAWKIVQVVRK